MGLIQGQMEIPTEHMANVFGQFDAYLKKIENALKVTIVVREQGLKLTGEEQKTICRNAASRWDLKLVWRHFRLKCVIYMKQY